MTDKEIRTHRHQGADYDHNVSVKHTKKETQTAHDAEVSNFEAPEDPKVEVIPFDQKGTLVRGKATDIFGILNNITEDEENKTVLLTVLDQSSKVHVITTKKSLLNRVVRLHASSALKQIMKEKDYRSTTKAISFLKGEDKWKDFIKKEVISKRKVLRFITMTENDSPKLLGVTTERWVPTTIEELIPDISKTIEEIFEMDTIENETCEINHSDGINGGSITYFLGAKEPERAQLGFNPTVTISSSILNGRRAIGVFGGFRMLYCQNQLTAEFAHEFSAEVNEELARVRSKERKLHFESSIESLPEVIKIISEGLGELSLIFDTLPDITEGYNFWKKVLFHYVNKNIISQKAARRILRLVGGEYVEGDISTTKYPNSLFSLMMASTYVGTHIAKSDRVGRALGSFGLELLLSAKNWGKYKKFINASIREVKEQLGKEDYKALWDKIDKDFVIHAKKEEQVITVEA